MKIVNAIADDADIATTIAHTYHVYDYNQTKEKTKHPAPTGNLL